MSKGVSNVSKFVQKNGEPRADLGPSDSKAQTLHSALFKRTKPNLDGLGLADRWKSGQPFKLASPLQGKYISLLANNRTYSYSDSLFLLW